jgi:prolyl 4-hydroxylase
MNNTYKVSLSHDKIEKLIKDKNYQDAEKELRNLISNKKQNYHTHFLLGNIYSILKKNEKALEQFKLSINLNSTNKIAHYHLGLIFDLLGELKDSKSSFENALKLDPDYPYANLAMALNFEKQNNIKMAKFFFEKTLSIDKDFNLGHQLYANFLTKIGQITKGQFHTYKYAGVIKIKENVINNQKIKRINNPNDKNFIGIWNINNDNLCKKIINFFEKRKDLQKLGEIGFGKNEKVKKSIDISLHPRNLTEEGFDDIKFFFNSLQECYEDYKTQWPFLKNNFTKLDIPSFNIQKYEIGGHFKMMHCERANIQSMHRIFAWMTYLNDVEDGGETYFEHFDLKIKPSTGKTLIWPAEWTHAHRGEILNKGNKYIITGWIHFPFNFIT